MSGLTIDKLAEQAGLEIDAVQFYERQGLIEPQPRTDSNCRLYPQEEVSRLRFIKQTKALGFSLDEIKDLLFLKHDPHATKKDIKNRTLSKIEEIQNEILDLYRKKGALEHLASSCDGHGPVDECPILEALDSNNQESLGCKHDHHSH